MMRKFRSSIVCSVCILVTCSIQFLFNFHPSGSYQTKKVSKLNSERHDSTLHEGIVLCTSTMGRYYNDMLSKSRKVPKDRVLAARLGHFNLLSKESLAISSQYPMRIYTEDSFDIANGRPPISEGMLDNVEYIDIFKVFPWLEDFVNNKKNSVYQFHQASKKLFGHTRTTEQTDLGLFRKVLAIADTLNNTPDGTIVLWLDLDTYFVKELPKSVLLYFLRADVTYIPSFTSKDCIIDFPFRNNKEKKYSCGLCAETGILSYRSSFKTRKVLEEQVNWIIGDALHFQKHCKDKRLNQPECLGGVKYGICNPLVSLNDIAVFGNSMLKNLYNITQQFLSTGCLKRSDGDWVFFAQMYKDSKAVLCPQDHLVLPTSPFNILEFIMHFRGTSSGLAKRRSVWDVSIAKPKASFLKSMEKNGASAQKLQKISA